MTADSSSASSSPTLQTAVAMRGVQKQNSRTVTSAMLGEFRTNARTRMEFLELLQLRHTPIMPGALGDLCAEGAD